MAKKLKKKHLEKYGFNVNDWSNEGIVIYEGWEKDGVMVQCLKDGFYVDGTDFKIKTVKQLKALYYGCTGKELVKKVPVIRPSPVPAMTDPPEPPSARVVIGAVLAFAVALAGMFDIEI